MSRVIASFCLLALAVAHASADPAAEQLFRDGRALLKAGKIDEACEKFQQSRDVEAKFGTVLNLADCRERQGKLATAWEMFLEAKSLAQTQKGAMDVAEAERRATLIAGKRAVLTVTIPAEDRVPGLVITRDGRALAPATWDQPLPIDPGTYTIEASASGYEPRAITVQVAAKAKATATVPALVKLAVVEPPLQPTEVVRQDVVRPVDRTPLPSAGITPRLRHAAFGLAFGFTHEGDATIGARVILQTPAGPGAVRGVIGAYYTKESPLDMDPAADVTRIVVWFGAEYLFAWRASLASAAGAGYGIENISGGYSIPEDVSSVTKGYPSLRLSPIIVRLSSAPLELGLHAVLDFRKDIQTGESSPVLVTTAALDWLFW